MNGPESEAHEPNEISWTEKVPIYGRYKTEQRLASKYTYVAQSLQKDEFYLRGCTMNPRLSEYPQCKDIIRDYWRCRDEHPVLSFLNICYPFKEELSGCLNLEFLRRQEKVRRKLPKNRRKSLQQTKEHFEKSVETKKIQIKEMNEKFID